MKKSLVIIAAIAAIFASCQKEEAAVSVSKKVVMTASLTASPISKLVMDGPDLSWEAGDVLSCRWASGVTYSDGSCETLTAIDDKVFRGEINEVEEIQNFYLFRLGGAVFTGNGASQISQTVAQDQKGTLQYIKDNGAFYLWQRKADIRKEGNQYVFSGVLNPFFGVVKLSVPASLGVTSISMAAESNIGGDFILNAARTYGTMRGVDESFFLDRYDKANNYKTITVSNGGQVYDGDVYFLVIPDAYDKNAKEYYCSTSKLTFTFTNATGDFGFTSDLKGKIYCNSLKDLGTVPSTLKPKVQAGHLCLLENNSPCISVTGAADNCEFYYETGSTLAEVKTPTVEGSAKMDLAKGVQVKYDQAYTNTFVKVLVHDITGTYSNVVLTGNARQWHLGKGEVYTELGKVKAGTALTTSDNNKYILTSNNLCIARRATTDMTTDVNFEYGTANQKLVNAIVFMPVVGNSTDNLYIYARVHSTTCVGTTKSRSYNMSYPKTYNDKTCTTTGFNRVTLYSNAHDSKDYSTSASVSGSLNKEVGLSWHLGQAVPGERFAFTQDGKVAIYNIAVLENL